jgi:hypothetical protein
MSSVKTSGVLTLPPPSVIRHAMNGLSQSGTYTVYITPLNIFGYEGPAILTDIDFTYSADSDEMSAADILDIRVDGDTVKDFSTNGYEVIEKGSVATVDTEFGKAMKFSGNGNYAVSGVKNHYADMESGFTMEVRFTTLEDLSGFHSLVSNMHAGGYGMDWDNGAFTFSVRIGTSYLGVDCQIQLDTTYHAVGVYTGSAVKLYINGALVGETPVSGDLVHPTDNGAKYLCIGADSDATSSGEYACEGIIYFVRMYSKAATDNQALFLFRSMAE